MLLIQIQNSVTVVSGKEYKHSHLMAMPVVAQVGHQNNKLGLTQTIQSYFVIWGLWWSCRFRRGEGGLTKIIPHFIFFSSSFFFSMFVETFYSMSWKSSFCNSSDYLSWISKIWSAWSYNNHVWVCFLHNNSKQKVFSFLVC